MADRYWVAGGTGNWSSTTNWSATTGGASGASVPGSADTARFNASSGAGTATVDSNVTIQTLTMTGFTGTLAFGTNTISLNSTGTIFTGDTTYSVTGTPVINVTSTGSTSITIGPNQPTEANSISFNFTGGTYPLVIGSTSSVRSLDFTGYAGTTNASLASLTCYGNLTLSTGMTLNTSNSTFSFSATSGTQLFTSNAKTFYTTQLAGAGGTVRLVDALTLGAGGAVFFLNNGTLDLNSKTLNCGAFSSNNANTRAILFGTGSITCTASGTPWTTATVTGLTITGTPVVKITSAGSTAITVAPGALSEANSISFNFTAGTYALAFLSVSSYTARNVDFTGFAGTWNARAIPSTIYGNLTLSTGMTFAASTGILTFGATSGTQVITSNAKTVDEPLTVNGVGGTVQLADALLMGTTRTLTHTNGTIDLNGKTLTVGTRYTTATGTKNLTFNGGTLVCPDPNATSFNNAQPTNYTTTAGTGTGKISMTAATAKTFVGGGSTFNCTLSNDGAGALTVSGSNTFTTIANGVQPTAFTFTAATTQTVTNWNVSGTAGNLVTIISSTAGVPALLSKASGTVSSNYLSLKDSTATGGATWYAGANSTNVSGNLGWVFTSAPIAYSLTANNGSYALTGRSVTITRGFSLLPQNGLYALTGRSVTITRGFLLSPQNGLYSLTGQAVDITYTPFTPPVTGPTQYFIEIRSFTESRRI